MLVAPDIHGHFLDAKSLWATVLPEINAMGADTGAVLLQVSHTALSTLLVSAGRFCRSQLALPYLNLLTPGGSIWLRAKNLMYCKLPK